MTYLENTEYAMSGSLESRCRLSQAIPRDSRCCLPSSTVLRVFGMSSSGAGQYRVSDRCQHTILVGEVGDQVGFASTHGGSWVPGAIGRDEERVVGTQPLGEPVRRSLARSTANLVALTRAVGEFDSSRSHISVQIQRRLERMASLVQELEAVTDDLNEACGVARSAYVEVQTLRGMTKQRPAEIVVCPAWLDGCFETQLEAESRLWKRMAGKHMDTAAVLCDFCPQQPRSMSHKCVYLVFVFPTFHTIFTGIVVSPPLPHTLLLPSFFVCFSFSTCVLL